MILLDTNAIVYYLHRVEPYASKVKQILIDRRDLAVTLRIVDEVIFTLIRLDALRRLGIRRLNQLREYIRKHGYKEFSEAINDVEELIEELGIIVHEVVRETSNIATKYGLLLNDTLIAATCKHYNISVIATLDEDFKRLPRLKVIP